MTQSKGPAAITPRYLALAEILRTKIAEGDPQIGDLLPTEHALCEAYSVSRHTVREALRLLAEAGLIARRRGAGTVVLAQEVKTTYAHRLGGLDDLTQYKRGTQLKHVRAEFVTLKPDQATKMGMVAQEYQRITGLRIYPGESPIAHTDIYIRSDLAPPAAQMVERLGAIADWLADERGVPTAKVDQAIISLAMPKDLADLLDAKEGEPALQTQRTYYDPDGNMMTKSFNTHPGARFTYEMTLNRECANC